MCWLWWQYSITMQLYNTRFLETLKETSYALCSTLEVSGAVKCVLHSASDWDGGRKKREKNVEAESQKSSDEEVERKKKSDNNDD